jgi:hypothetical protein
MKTNGVTHLQVVVHVLTEVGDEAKVALNKPLRCDVREMSG